MAWADDDHKKELADKDAIIEQLEGVIAARDKTILKLKGELPTVACPCGHPDDHAGWCPRREV